MLMKFSFGCVDRRHRVAAAAARTVRLLSADKLRSTFYGRPFYCRFDLQTVMFAALDIYTKKFSPAYGNQRH